MSIDQIPDELKQLIQFCVWRYELLQGETKPRKIPYNPKTGAKVSTTDPQTWCSFQEAVEAANGAANWAGIGFVFSERDPYCGIDLDDPYALKEDGTPKFSTEKAAEIAERNGKILSEADSYTELSPSGKGVHIIIKARVSSGRRRDAVEIYSSGRYFTMTGNVIRDRPIAERHDLANTLCEEMGRSGSTAEASDLAIMATETDAAIWERASRAENGEKFLVLWKGDWRQLGYPSQSEADFALIDIIAYQTRNREQIARIFRASALGERDKAKRDNYVTPMIVRAIGDQRPQWNQLPTIDYSRILPASVSANDVVTPFDMWANFDPPSLPTGLLPPIIEQFARTRGFQMGADAGGIAASALAVCAAVISDGIQLQVKRHDPSWTESARLWVALVGMPSTKKSPIMREAARPLFKIDAELFRAYAKAKAEYDALDKKERGPAPRQTRLRLEDTTIEAAQDVLKDSPDGVLCYQDELSGWFGSMDKYSGARGAAKDRGFWLSSFNGGQYALNRINRGVELIDNLSISILGGIQPETIRKLAADTHDDGLLQRLFVIVLQSATIGSDQPAPDIANEYGSLIERLHRLAPTRLFFDGDAQAMRDQLEKRHLYLTAIEAINPKLAAHIGKYDGLFARLCVIWHCIEHAFTFGNMPTVISGQTAYRVATFLHEYFLPHAISFFVGILGVSDDQDVLKSTAGYILSRPEKSEITFRDVSRGDRQMRALDHFEARKVLQKLEALGWLLPIPVVKERWAVNPECHRLFADRGNRERERREQARQMIAETLGSRH
ncbi:DUF3987 domain-containing protein [Mesorhizobium captivum]|uniref:DUF3987 domain-containing protein n=1 Tax=Mesorhizobium captivum TaxID=3072319 RepID=UPI002A240C9C|nr:DUF3987 domain-containing protein [Mesorhizobium sp. VK23E]MDX8513594.1 DUF3987 domain-containing protein [Mesorhizobium sp. VK23E]